MSKCQSPCESCPYAAIISKLTGPVRKCILGCKTSSMDGRSFCEMRDIYQSLNRNVQKV